MRSNHAPNIFALSDKISYKIAIYYHVPGGFAVGAGPVRRPGEAPREGVSSKNGWG